MLFSLNNSLCMNISGWRYSMPHSQFDPVRRQHSTTNLVTPSPFRRPRTVAQTHFLISCMYRFQVRCGTGKKCAKSAIPVMFQRQRRDPMNSYGKGRSAYYFLFGRLYSSRVHPIPTGWMCRYQNEGVKDIGMMMR